MVQALNIVICCCRCAQPNCIYGPPCKVLARKKYLLPNMLSEGYSSFGANRCQFCKMSAIIALGVRPQQCWTAHMALSSLSAAVDLSHFLDTATHEGTDERLSGVQEGISPWASTRNSKTCDEMVVLYGLAAGTLLLSSTKLVRLQVDQRTINVTRAHDMPWGNETQVPTTTFHLCVACRMPGPNCCSAEPDLHLRRLTRFEINHQPSSPTSTSLSQQPVPNLAPLTRTNFLQASHSRFASRRAWVVVRLACEPHS